MCVRGCDSSKKAERKLISIRNYILKLVSVCKWAHIVCCRERPDDECGTEKIPDGQQHSYRRAVHGQPTTADAVCRMLSASSSSSCGQSFPEQCKAFASSLSTWFGFRISCLKPYILEGLTVLLTSCTQHTRTYGQYTHTYNISLLSVLTAHCHRI